MQAYLFFARNIQGKTVALCYGPIFFICEIYLETHQHFYETHQTAYNQARSKITPRPTRYKSLDPPYHIRAPTIGLPQGRGIKKNLRAKLFTMGRDRM